MPGIGDSVIDEDSFQSCDTRDFLETSYPNFNSLKNSLGLGVAMEYNVHTKQGNYSELKYATSAIAVESLVSHGLEYFSQIGA